MKRKNAERKKLETRRSSENLRRLMTGFKSLLEHHLREESITLPQLRLLKAVQQQTGVSSASLARTCLVTPQTMQSILARAVREQWIVRAKSNRNERILTASLTPLGEEVLARGLEMAARLEEQLWRHVSLSELEALNNTLDEAVSRLNHLEQEALQQAAIAQEGKELLQSNFIQPAPLCEAPTNLPRTPKKPKRR